MSLALAMRLTKPKDLTPFVGQVSSAIRMQAFMLTHSCAHFAAYVDQVLSQVPEQRKLAQ